MNKEVHKGILNKGKVAQKELLDMPERAMRGLDGALNKVANRKC